MIFNKDNKGCQELRELTGNYYASNEFNKMLGFIHLATDELSDLIGSDVYKEADKLYQDGATEEKNKEFIRKVQQPIAIMATLRMYQRNDLSHEDDGRKFKIDPENEKLPWQWQLDRDDEMHLEDYYTAVDSLIRYLNASDNEKWKESPAYKQSQLMLIQSGKEFEEYFPIQKSERSFLLLLPFMKEVQFKYTKKSYGTGRWDELLALKSNPESEVYFAACKATALLTMAMALRRMQLSIIPSGVIRKYVIENGSMSSKPATIREVKQIADWMEEDGKQWLNEMKIARDGGSIEYKLLPDNDKRNKYCRL